MGELTQLKNTKCERFLRWLLNHDRAVHLIPYNERLLRRMWSMSKMWSIVSKAFDRSRNKAAVEIRIKTFGNYVSEIKGSHAQNKVDSETSLY